MSSQYKETNEPKEKPGKTRVVFNLVQNKSNQNRNEQHSQPMGNMNQNRKAEREKVTIAKAITSVTD